MSVEVAGHVAPGFEQVADAFERNFTEHVELGAAFAAVLDGETVVDLWGGVADSGPPAQPWREDTLQLIFSGTKGLVAVCLLMLVDRGELALDDPVCEHWPEFAANGKGAITVAEVASHRGRLPAIRTPIEEDDLTDDVRLAALLAAQAPETDPRSVATYHGLTYGWLCGELIRRVAGRSVGRFFAEEVAGPLGLELWIGLPEAQEPRVSTLVYASDWAPPTYSAEQIAADPLLAALETNPPVLVEGRLPWNTRAFHAAEIPAINAVGSARSIARLYACLARGGELGGVRLMRPETVELGRRELSRFDDALMDDEPFAFGVGFELQTERFAFGPPPAAFGHSGAGGSIHAAWPEQRLGVSYVMNELRTCGAGGDPRSQTLLRALFDATRAG